MTRHARERMAERYGLTLAPRDWQRLAQTIERWPWEPDGRGRVAFVPIVLPGEVLTVPILYSQTPGGPVLVTVLPGGVSRPA